MTDYIHQLAYIWPNIVLYFKTSLITLRHEPGQYHRNSYYLDTAGNLQLRWRRYNIRAIGPQGRPDFGHLNETGFCDFENGLIRICKVILDLNKISTWEKTY